MSIPLNIDLTKVGPDIFKLIGEIIEAIHKNSEGGTKITVSEWLEIGQAAGFVVIPVVESIMHTED